MEYVPGPNLAQLVERDGPLTRDKTLRLLREALSALAHAHGAGLVHRDIKPENLLFERDGSLRITDFGLALALRGQGMFGGATSQSGTPRFASPEQLLGERVDGRSDLYSLAAVAYFALLGTPPFEGATPVQVLARQTTNELPPLHDARPDVGPEIEEVLHRALRAEAKARFPTASEFLAALNRAVRRSAATSIPGLRRDAHPDFSLDRLEEPRRSRNLDRLFRENSALWSRTESQETQVFQIRIRQSR